MTQAAFADVKGKRAGSRAAASAALCLVLALFAAAPARADDAPKAERPPPPSAPRSARCCWKALVFAFITKAPGSSRS